MKKILIFVVILSFAFACGGDATEKGDATEGKEVYAKYCVACHGPNGNLALNGAKKFPESTLNVEERVLVITNGRNMMTPFKGLLNEKEIEAAAAYTMILSEKE